MQPDETTAVEDVVAELRLSKYGCFEFRFCIFNKTKLIEYSKRLLGRSDYFQEEFFYPVLAGFAGEEFQVI